MFAFYLGRTLTLLALDESAVNAGVATAAKLRKFFRERLSMIAAISLPDFIGYPSLARLPWVSCFCPEAPS
jgi:hypothetical protein